jgi:uncharacterized protein YegL
MPAERITSNSPWHLVLVLDDSQSMAQSGASSHLNQALDTLLEEMKLLSQGLKPYFKVSVIAFGSSTELIAEAESEQTINKGKITSFAGTRGTTDMAGALRKAAEVLKRNPGKPTDFTPFIYLLTDGQPDNESAALAAAQEIHDLDIPAGKPHLCAIGLGNQVKMDFLERVASNSELARPLSNPGDIAKALPPVGTIVSSGGGAAVADQAIIDL